MRHLLPKPVERVALRVAFRLRCHWRRIAKPRLRAISVVIRDPAGRVLFIRHSYGPRGWTLPGGGVGRREDPVDAARREMREELGLDLEQLDLIDTISETLTGAQQSAYVFTAITQAEPCPDGREVVDARFFPLDDLPGPLSPPNRRRLAALRAAQD